jgi:predicted small secreted protein
VNLKKTTMKIFFLIAMSGLVLTACKNTEKKAGQTTPTMSDSAKFAAVNDTTNFTTIEWLDSTEKHYPGIKEGDILELSYKFKNSGTKPLIIASASGECGCTGVTKPEAPVMPGETGVIAGKFNSSGKPHTNNKGINITSNTNPANKRLVFIVDVTPK